MPAGFVQLWASAQLEQGAAGCSNYIGITGPHTLAIIISNDSECILQYRSDVDPVLFIPARTALTIPCQSNMQYVVSVDVASTATANTNQLVILSETAENLAYASTPLPAVNLIQFIAAVSTPSEVLTIPPQFTGIILLPVAVGGAPILFLQGKDSGYLYIDQDNIRTPVTIQLYPGLEPSNTYTIDTGSTLCFVYGLTVPLTAIGTPVTTEATITAPLRDASQDGVVPSVGPSLVGTLALSAAIDDGTGAVDRLRALGDNADTEPVGPVGRLLTLARQYGYNGTSWDRLRALGDNADNVPVNTLGGLLSIARLYAYNGASWDRVRGDTVGMATFPPDSGIITFFSGTLPVGTYFGPGQSNTHGARGVEVNIHINSIGGGASVTMRLTPLGLDGVDHNALVTTPSITAVGGTTILCYPGITAIANVSANAILPYLWRPEIVLSTGAANVTVLYHYIP